MTHELISTTCISAGEGFYVSSALQKDARDRPTPDAMDQIIAWRIDTYRLTGDEVPISTICPITINGSIDTSDFMIVRPDGNVEYPDGFAPRSGRAGLHLVQDKAR